MKQVDMWARRLPLVAVLSGTLALTGCTQASDGASRPDATRTTSSGSDATDPVTSIGRSSRRPRDIDLTGKDPCAQIPRTDWPKFGIEKPGEYSEEPTFTSPSCYYSGIGDVTLVVTEGVEAWRQRTRNVEISETTEIGGFPTVTIWNKVDRRSCYAAVDVSDGQHLLVTASSVHADVDRAQTCDRAYRLAESAMGTLVTS